MRERERERERESDRSSERERKRERDVDVERDNWRDKVKETMHGKLAKRYSINFKQFNTL